MAAASLAGQVPLLTFTFLYSDCPVLFASVSVRKGNLIQILLLFLLLSIAFGSLNSLEDECRAPLTAPRPAFVFCLQRTAASRVIGVVLHVVRRQMPLSQGCFSIR